MLTFSLEVGSFFLQFLDWWYSQDNNNGSQNINSSNLPPPPPVITGKSDKFRASIKKRVFKVAFQYKAKKTQYPQKNNGDLSLH